MATTDQLIQDARNYASNALDEAQSALADANRSVSSIGYIVPNVDPLVLDGELVVPTQKAPPVLQGAELTLPDEPTRAEPLRELGSIDTSGMPLMDVIAPSLVMPDRPTGMPEFTATPPDVNTDAEFPDVPDQLVNPLVEEPTITDRAAPDKPTFVVPTFDAQLPVNTAEAPTDLAGKMDAAYDRMNPRMVAVMDAQVDAFIAKHNPRFAEQMSALEGKLAGYLQGGTALSPAVEAALASRAHDRNNAEFRRVQDTAWGDAASRGHTLPDGALAAAVRMARQGAADNNARTSAEIAIKQAELEQQNIQFAITTSMGLRQTILSAAMNYHQSLITINGQSLEYAKTTAQLLVESYNIAVRAYEAALEGFRAEVQLFETRLRAVTAAIEIYKAEIEALQALTQVDLAKINVYRARVEVLQTLAQVYRTRVDAVVSKAQLERLKLDLFGSQVQLFTARVQAKGLEWNGYRSAIEGEQSKAQLYTSQVQGKVAEIGAWRSRIEAQAEGIRATAMTNDSITRQYESAWRGYSAAAAARGEVARTKLENDRQTLAAFQAETQASVSYATMAATYYRTKADVKISYNDQKLRAQLAMGESMKAFQGTLAQLALTGSEQYTGLAQTAMAGMNTLVSQEAG